MPLFEKGRKKTGGRQKGTRNVFSIEALERAFKKAKKKHNKISILDHLANLAYTDSQLAIALLKFRMPTLRSVETTIKGEIPFAERTPSEICDEMDQLTLGEKDVSTVAPTQVSPDSECSLDK